MIQTAIWLPPSDCGCQLKITADFRDESIVAGFTHRHPRPLSIRNIEIVNCCDRHAQAIKRGMQDTDHLFGECNITGNKIQQRGYLKLPIEKPTDAEILYQYLCGHKSQTRSYPCGCRAYMWGDFNSNYKYIFKDGITRKCFRHLHDTIDMAQAQAEFDASIPKTDDQAQPE